MALFKAMVGADKSALDIKSLNEGYCWFTTEDGKFYIDAKNSTGTLSRILLNAGKADQLTTGRTLKVNLARTSASTAFDGTEDITNIGVSGTLALANGGTGSATAEGARTNLGLEKAIIGIQGSTQGITYTFADGTTSSAFIILSDAGSTTKPIYITGGTIAAGSTYAGGTKVTLNGSSKGASTASFYAPTAVGSSGQILKSNGSNAPTWSNVADIISIATGSTNGTISVNTNGTAAEIAIKGLGSNAYTSTSYLPSAGGNVTGHIYLTGAQESSSTGNTSQIIFGTSSDNHLALSSNRNALVINPTVTETTNQIILYLEKASEFPKGIITNITGNCSGSAGSVDWSGVTSKPSYYDAKAIKSITRSGTTFTYTCMDGTTSTFTQQDNDTTYSAATTSAAGLMSASDKSKLDGIATGANKITVDSALSSTSTNPVQNKAVNTAISNLNTLVGSTSVAQQIENGTAAMANKLKTARTIAITGDAIGSTSFDGSDNITIETSVFVANHYTGTFSASGWSSSVPHTQTITVSGIKSTDTPLIDLNMSSATASNGTQLTEQWALIGRITTGTNTVTAYCYSDIPTLNIPINIMTIK